MDITTKSRNGKLQGGYNMSLSFRQTQFIEQKVLLAVDTGVFNKLLFERDKPTALPVVHRR
jgi:hypothetical protein